MTPTTAHRMDSTSSPGQPNETTEGMAGTAREEAGHLRETSADAARQVANTAKDKASEVTSDLRQQSRQLAGQTRDELVEQAGRQKDRAADSLRAVSEELRGMADHGQSGWAAQVARQGADLGDRAAAFLQDREPGDLLDEIRALARRKPGTFLLGAAAAGVVAGRLSRALAAGAPDTASSSTTGRSPGIAAGDEGMGYLSPPARQPVTPASDPLAEPLTPPPMPTPVASDPDPRASSGPGVDPR